MKILKNENIIVLQNEDFLIMKDKTKIQKIKCENGILVIDNLNLKKLKQIIKNEGNTKILKIIQKKGNEEFIVKTLYRNPIKIVIKITDILYL